MVRFAALACAVLLFAACQPEQVEKSSGFQLVTEQGLEKDCKSKGGELKKAGLTGRLVCITTPRDAGKTCQSGAECSTGQCLARSRSCAPVSPLFGCNALIDKLGREVTLCVD